MTRKVTRKTHTLRVIAQLFGLLTVLIALGALAQTKAAGHPPAKFAVVAAASHDSEAQLAKARQPLLPDHGTGAVDSGDPLFLTGETDLLEGRHGRAIAAGDVNGDGVPDLLVGSACNNIRCNQVGVIELFLGQGDGTFRQAGSYGSDGAPLTSVAIADLNGDGNPEIVATEVACHFQGCSTSGIVNIIFTANHGFLVYDTGSRHPEEVAIADVNGDGKPDLVIANCGASNCTSATGVVGVLLGNGDATFQPAVTFGSGGIGATSVAVADVNGDGKPDLVVANLCAILANCSGLAVHGSVAALLGNGDGTFQTPVVYDAGGSLTESVRIADLNGDGKADIVVANEFNGGVGVLLGNGNGTFQTVVVYPAGDAGQISIADVNQDGKPDLVVANGFLGVLLGNGDGTFQPMVETPTVGRTAFWVAVADLNGDGRPDAAVVDNCSNSKCLHGLAEVFLNNTGPHSPTTTALVSNVNPAAVNQQVIYTATVTNQSGGPMTGTITFQHGANTIVRLVNGQASYSVTYTKTGKHAITAIYSGDTANESSTSPTLIEYIGLAPTTTTLSTSGSPSQVGQSVTFTANVTWTYGVVPNGELITFFDGTTVIGTGTTASGVATFSTSSLSAKTHTIKAKYPGDVTFKLSKGSVSQVVQP